MMRHQRNGKVFGVFWYERRSNTDMFKAKRSNSTLGSTFSLLELIYHATVRNLRKSHRHAVLGLLSNIVTAMILVFSLYVMSVLFGIRHSAVRGDYLLYVMSGVFPFMTQTRTMGAVFGAETSTSAMMLHAPMTTAVSVASAAMAALYVQVFSLVVVLYVYHVAFNPIEIDDWVGALGMLLLSWFVGIGFGLVFRAARPWAPEPVRILQTIFARVNMIASGKMFLANNLSHKMLAMFSWNPLFHTIDQTRGFTFRNYYPHFSNWEYPLIVALSLVMIGLMGDFYTRQHASLSWTAGK